MNELCCKYLSVRCIWLYVIILSHTIFRVNPHSVVSLNIKELLAWSRRHISSLSDSNVILTHNHIVRKRIHSETPHGDFTLKRIYSEMRIHSETRTWHDNNIQSNAQDSSIIWPVWPNCWVFIYELSGFGFESRCCHLLKTCYQDQFSSSDTSWIRLEDVYKTCVRFEYFLKMCWRCPEDVFASFSEEALKTP